MKKLGVFVLILHIVGIGASLSACGQKGPLHLPNDKPQKQGS